MTSSTIVLQTFPCPMRQFPRQRVGKISAASIYGAGNSMNGEEEAYKLYDPADSREIRRHISHVSHRTPELKYYG